MWKRRERRGGEKTLTRGVLGWGRGVSRPWATRQMLRRPRITCIRCQQGLVGPADAWDTPPATDSRSKAREAVASVTRRVHALRSCPIETVTEAALRLPPAAQHYCRIQETTKTIELVGHPVPYSNIDPRIAYCIEQSISYALVL